jgi:hypothetical protein
MEQRTVSGADFLWLVLQHVLAQGLSPGAQLRLFAPQLQARDHLAARAAEVRSWSDLGLGQATGADSVHLLWSRDGDRANAHSFAVHGAAAHLHRG